ncbi:release factor glutamine methyltransferase [Allostella sp. ATCC 35155]|nr:release factor glutamine methyltransferase [Stella sp. ATCC 35155]
MTGDGDALFRQAVARLAAAGLPEAAREARLILAHAAGRAGEVVFARDVRLDAAAAARFGDAVDRRASREPLSRIVGQREFWSLPFALGPATLDPRPDTEVLVEGALRRLGRCDRPWRILDLGTGTGCIALALLSELPAATAVGVDRSPQAAALAHDNAVRLGLADRFAVIAGDWTQALSSRFDLIVSNPPYIVRESIPGLDPEVARHDPLLALDGGSDGLVAYRAIVPELAGLLAPDGIVGLEIGCDQAAAVTGLLTAAGFADVDRVTDLAGLDRCLFARTDAGSAAKPVKKSLAPPSCNV